MTTAAHLMAKPLRTSRERGSLQLNSMQKSTLSTLKKQLRPRIEKVPSSLTPRNSTRVTFHLNQTKMRRIIPEGSLTKMPFQTNLRETRLQISHRAKFNKYQRKTRVKSYSRCFWSQQINFRRKIWTKHRSRPRRPLLKILWETSPRKVQISL